MTAADARRRRAGEAPISLSAGIALVLGSTLITLGGLELALVAVGYENAPLAIQIGDTTDARAYHMFQDDSFEYDAQLIWRPRRGLSVFNRQGFRGPDLALPKPQDEFRIFAVGDSNTLGWAGADGANWPSDLHVLLQSVRPGATVVNAGVWGYASYQGLVRLRETLTYDPDLVLISFGSNDAHRVLQSDRDYAEHPIRSTDVGQLLRRFRLGQFVLSALQGASSGYGGRLQPRVDLDEYRSNLETMIDEARSRDVAIVLLTRPYVGEIDNPRWWKNWGADYNEATVEVADRLDVPVVDVYSLFKGRDELFADESHFTPEGHRLAAAAILDRIRPMVLAGS